MQNRLLFSCLFGIVSMFNTGYTTEIKKTEISLPIPAPEDSAGGIIVADVNDDNAMDFLVTVPGHLAVFDNSGQKLWLKKTDIGVGGQSESQGLPGHNGPGVAAGDIDGDGKTEIIYLTKQDSSIHIVDGKTGEEEHSITPPVPKGAERWEVAFIADFRGNKADHDLLLQATNKSGYRMGRYLAAYSYKNLVRNQTPLWTTDEFLSCAHNGARLADLDGDSRDEILGATIFSHNGKLVIKAQPFKGHMDSVFVAEVNPKIPGLEVILLEEGSNFVQVLGLQGPLWRKDFKRQEPQNAVIGRFQPGSDEIFIWCRSRYNEHQKPFIFNSNGKKVIDYKMDDVAPTGWTASGVEIIHKIDWTGERLQLACATERHRSGDVCLFEPLTGKFVERISEKADRLYVADVYGDWREEIIVLNGNQLNIYENKSKNPRPNHKRLWSDGRVRLLPNRWLA
jgi:hypothetical protein